MDETQARTEQGEGKIKGLTFYEGVDGAKCHRDPKRTTPFRDDAVLPHQHYRRFFFSFLGNAEVEAAVECKRAPRTEREWFEVAVRVVEKWSRFGGGQAFDIHDADFPKVAVIRATGIDHCWRDLHRITCSESGSYAQQDVPTFRVDRQVHGMLSLVFCCPKCGQRNTHGGGKVVFTDSQANCSLPDSFGHRKSHCDCWPKGYSLEARRDYIPF